MRMILVSILVFIAFIYWRETHREKVYVPVPPEFEGAWDSGCGQKNEQGENHTVSRTQVIYKGDTVEEFSIVYADASCEHAAAFERNQGRIRYQLDASTDGYKTDAVYEHFYWTLLTDDAVRKSNSHRLYGFSDWRAHEEREVTGRSGIPGGHVREKAGAELYDIMKLSGDHLVFGDRASGDGARESTRPDRFEEASFGYTKMTEPPSVAGLLQQSETAANGQSSTLTRNLTSTPQKFPCICQCYITGHRHSRGPLCNWPNTHDENNVDISGRVVEKRFNVESREECERENGSYCSGTRASPNCIGSYDSKDGQITQGTFICQVPH